MDRDRRKHAIQAKNTAYGFNIPSAPFVTKTQVKMHGFPKAGLLRVVLEEYKNAEMNGTLLVKDGVPHVRISLEKFTQELTFGRTVVERLIAELTEDGFIELKKYVPPQGTNKVWFFAVDFFKIEEKTLDFLENKAQHTENAREYESDISYCRNQHHVMLKSTALREEDNTMSSSSLRSEEERAAERLLVRDEKRGAEQQEAEQALERDIEVRPVENQSQAEDDKPVVRLKRNKPVASPDLSRAQMIRNLSKDLDYDLPDPTAKNIAVSSKVQAAIDYWNSANLNGQGLSQLTCPKSGQAQTAKFKRCVKLINGFFKGTTFAQYKTGTTARLTIDDFEAGVDRFLQVIYNPEVSSGSNKKEFLLTKRDLELFLSTPDQSKGWHKEPFFLQYGLKDPAPASVDTVKDPATYDTLVSLYRKGMGLRRDTPIEPGTIKHLTALSDVLVRLFKANVFGSTQYRIETPAQLAQEYMDLFLGVQNTRKQAEFSRDIMWCWSKPTMKKFLDDLDKRGLWRGARQDSAAEPKKNGTPSIAEQQRMRREAEAQARIERLKKSSPDSSIVNRGSGHEECYDPEYDDERLADQLGEED